VICAVADNDVDVLVLGAGIIGLACAREILRTLPDARVTVLEQGSGLCHAATGAGQGCATQTVRVPVSKISTVPPPLLGSRLSLYHK
jgi:glycine/D-amino acid oxidase-like deaminating enzyme